MTSPKGNSEFSLRHSMLNPEVEPRGTLSVKGKQKSPFPIWGSHLVYPATEINNNFG